MNKVILFFGVIFLLSSGLFAGSCSPCREVYPDQFSVRGNKIVDSREQEIIFRGVAAVDPLHQVINAAEDEAVWSEEYFRSIASWGATLVRVPIHPQQWQANSLEENFRILDQTLSWIAENNMYAIIDFHSIGYPPAEDFESSNDGIYLTTIEEWKQFWRDMAFHYQSNKTVVFYELFNEPVFSGYSQDAQTVYPSRRDWLAWRTCQEDLIKDIRVIDHNKIIIVSGLSWAYDISFAGKDPIRANNIVYATHPYPNSNWNTSWGDAFGKLKEKYPVMVTEFGFEITGDKAEVKYKGLHRYRDDIIRYLEDKKISWVAWSFSNKWMPALLSDKNGNPNEAGHFFRDKLRQ